MDLVVNHSSDRHAWFRRAVEDRNAPEHDYYVWRDPGPNGEPPYARTACFGGPVWNWVEEVGQYYLGYFSAAQPDLNWQNPRLRREVYDMMNWWLDRGIAGFRMDVISLIGKDPDAGVFENGPDLHRFLQEMHEATLAGRDVVTVGETWSVTPETALLYCGRDRRELSMVFQFNHVTAFEDPVEGKWKQHPFDLVRFKRSLFTWQRTLAEDGWNSLFLSNHDLPRAVSRYGDDGVWRVALGQDARDRRLPDARHALRLPGRGDRHDQRRLRPARPVPRRRGARQRRRLERRRQDASSRSSRAPGPSAATTRGRRCSGRTPPTPASPPARRGSR